VQLLKSVPAAPGDNTVVALATKVNS